MHIVFATTEYNYDGIKAGGLAAYLVKISQLLLEKGHSVSICTLASNNRTINENGVTVYELKERIHPLFMTASAITALQWHKAWLWKSKSFEMRKLLRRVNSIKKIDVIQYSSTYGLSYFTPAEIPHCVRNSGLLYQYNSAEGISGWKEKQKEHVQIKALLHCEHIYGPSQTTNDLLAADYAKQSTLIKTPSRADSSRKHIEVIEAIKGKYLLFFGTLNTIKGIHFIGPLLEKFLKQNPTFKFVFAGSNGTIEGVASSQYLRNCAGPYADRCIYAGLIPKEQLYPLIKNSYAVIIPSLIDNGPNTVMEAMSFGKVVLSSMDGSIREMILDGYNGYNVAVENKDTFLRALNDLCSLSSSELGKLEQNTLIKIEEHNPQRIVMELLGYYEKVIKSFS